MKIFIINEEEKEKVREQLMDAKNEIERIQALVERGEIPQQSDDPMVGPPGPPFGIVLNGHSLVIFIILIMICMI